MIRPRTEAFKYYFLFVQERMNIFWKKYKGYNMPYTNDGILAANKFTNVYRATDRVSQYLISNVIYGKEFISLKEEDIILRILIFKVFNRIDTWEYIESHTGTLTISNFNVEKISQILAYRITRQPIFNNAYMMAGSHEKYNHYLSKHEKWLRMIEKEMIKKGLLHKIVNAKSLSEIFDLLNQCTFIGGFLAYQYAIDINYSPVVNFDENSFVKAGIGAIRGIKKCFPNLGKYSYEDAIKFTQDHFLKYQSEFGFTEFKNLFGRELKLIDIQNCFCETDKYLRVALPELQVDNVRIKQKYVQSHENLAYYFFPPKWNINQSIDY